MTRSRAVRSTASALLVAAVYFVAAKLGLRLAFANASATAVWPPTGIALAALLLLGPRAWPGVFLGAFLANITTQGSIPVVAGIATGNTLEAILGATLLRRLAGGASSFSRPQDVFKFTLLASLLSTTASASIGVTSLALGGYASWIDFGPIWLTWWLGDATGDLVVAPLLLLWLASPPPAWSRRRLIELGAWLLALVVAGEMVFGQALGIGVRNYPLEFLCLPLLVGVAFRFGPRATTTATVLLAGIALRGTLMGFGPFAKETPEESLLLLQVFMGIVAMTGLLLASAVSERRRMEAALRESEERLRQSQKMEAVGRLAGGVAHVFNNMLTAILGYSDLLLGQAREADPAREGLEEIRAAGLRVAGLTRQLLAFGRKQILRPSVVNLGAVLAEMDGMMRGLLGERVDLRVIPGSDLRDVHVDRDQIEQAIMSLVINANDAMPAGGRLTIETSNASVTGGSAERRREVSPGLYVMLKVTDTGTGMDEATREHAFEPFFTTKDQGRAMGMGLAAVHGLIEQSGGRILVDSRVGAGTSFIIYLSAAAPRPAVRASLSPAGEEPARGTILVAEDEETLLRMVGAALESHGYLVLEARGGEEALEIAARPGVHVDLLLTDVVMPRMNGRELAERMSRLHPHLKVLFMSGYTEDHVLRRSVMDAGVAFIAKPFRIEDLVRTVRSIIAPASAGRRTEPSRVQ
jgi:signal transduction histidine kinase/CheY-like chemotaxis protein